MFHLWLLLVFGLCTLEARSESLPRDANLREACRKQVAGLYLSIYDEHKKNEQYLRLLKEKNIALQKSQAETQIKLRHIKKQLENSRYDLEISNKHDQIDSMVSLLESSLSENHQLSTEASKKQQELSKQLKELKVKISNLFNFKKIKGKGAGYKFHIDYKDTCPPYRYSCPLPREKAKKLTAIFPQEEVPLVCQRYASFLNW